ncbi:hypothetical protein DPX16_13466 [Anabarilius grahami]|uniref:Retrotransposon gag domain-containing protein n=1 Tax=Anabarilius grahami TaxID=495550 RepID=A0A3N0YV76_ANAGA|nr:hypothetical protein DPX16_13466 [Anabarilius grahami]
MGIFLVPIPSTSHRPKVSAVDHLWTLRQDGRPLERYVEEFSELSCLVNWPDAPLNACFLKGLDDDTIRYSEPACFFSLVKSINLILFLNGSDFEIEEVQEKSYLPRPVPSETQATWPVRQPPVSSTYPSSGSSHVVLLDLKPKPPMKMAAAAPEPLNKVATAKHKPPKKMAAAKPKPPKKMAASASKPRHKMASAKPKPPRKMAAAAPEPQGKMANAAPGPQGEMAATKSKPSPEEDHWLIDFWTEPEAPVLHEPAPGFHKHVPAYEPFLTTTDSPKEIEGGPYTHGWGTYGWGSGTARATQGS